MYMYLTMIRNIQHEEKLIHNIGLTGFKITVGPIARG